MLKTGNTDISAVKLGTTDVTAIYVGADKIWPAGLLELSASSLDFAAAGQAQQLTITVEDGKEWTVTGLPSGWSASALSGAGPATVTVTAANNTSTTARTGTLTVNSEGLSAACSLSQTAGAKVFEAPIITDFHYTGTGMTYDNKGSYATAAGGSFTSILTYYQDYTWNGVAGSGGRLTTGAAVNCSGTGVASNGNLTMPSKGTTFSAQSLFTEVAITISMNGKSYTGHHKVYQAANYVVAAKALKTRTLTYPQIGAGGGTSNVQWDAYPTDADIDKLWGFTWVSGADGTWSQAKLGGSNAQTGMSYKWTGASGNFTALNTSTGAVTASSKGTTVNGVTSSPAITATQTCKFTNNAAYGGSSVSWDTTATGTCSQAANAVTGYGTPTGRTLSVTVIPASGGSVSSGTLGGTITQSRTFTSGASDTLTNPTVSASSYSAAVSGANQGTTVKPRTAKGTLTYYYTCNGKQGSCSAAVFQAANYLTGLTVTPSAFSYSVAPAAAGNSIPSNSGSDTQTFTFASGTTSTSGNISGIYYTVSSSQKYSWPGAAGFFSSLNTSNGVVTTTTAGTTPISSQLAGPLVTRTLTMTYTPTSALGAGTTLTKSGTKTAYPQKGINKKTASSSSCVSGTTKLRTYYVWTSGADGGFEEVDNYTCGYRVTLGVGISIMQSGVMVSPVINTMRAYSCWGNTVQYQGTSYVDFPNPSFGENAATLTLNQSETSNHSSITYVLYQCNITYTDSGGTGAIPNYVWSNAVTYSGSLAIYTAANAPSAMLTVSAATRSGAADAAVASDVPAASGSVAADATALLERIESGELKVPDGLAERLREMAGGTDDGK